MKNYLEICVYAHEIYTYYEYIYININSLRVYVVERLLGFI